MVLIFGATLNMGNQPIGCAPSSHRATRMSEANYAPPTANLYTETHRGPAFFTVSPTKLMIMMLATSGLYGLYWHYRNWALYKQRFSLAIWPLPRAWFGVLFMPSLLSKLDRELEARGKARMASWKLTAVLYISLAFAPMIFGFMFGLVRGAAGYPPQPPNLNLIVAVSAVALVLMGLILSRVQGFINLLNDDPLGSTNAKLSDANWVWILIGAIYWVVNYYVALAMNSAGS
jgi:hypothetical protein